jgi:DNA-binding SARP family transcriptional activator/tetratricopeptide (TPR) repeat protein
MVSCGLGELLTGAAVEFRVLGAVEVRVRGHALPIGPPQQCHVLAALAVDAGRPVSAEALIDRVWDRAPGGARRTLHVYVTRIRRLLEQDEPPVRIIRGAAGYVLDVAADSVDVLRFRRLVEHAAAADRAPRVALLRQALDLWQGEPLAGLPGEWAERMRVGWCQQRVDAAVAWAEAELAGGNAATVISPLAELVGRYRFVEPLVAVLMRALHASGRTAEALACYRTARQQLVDELGTEPGVELQRVHQAVLRGGPGETPPPREAISLARRPAQLPLDVAFVGRSAELARLDAVAAGAPMAIAVLSGAAGVGKTALAVHWAHRVRSRFPDGQLYANLRGFGPSGPPASPTDVINRFLDAMGVPQARIPVDADAQAALYRTVLSDRQVLVLLDNARDADQVRPLLPGGSTAVVVVTSRNRLTGLVAAEGANPVPLDPLPITEAVKFLTRRLGEQRVAHDPAAVHEIIAQCAGLPLALAVIAARAATYPEVALSALARALRDAHTTLDAFAGTDPATDVRAVFSWSYHQLSPRAARLFRLLGIHVGPDIGEAGAASLAGVSRAEAVALLSELTAVHLVTEHAPGRYTLHDLLHAYAAELVPEVERRTALPRLLDHYLHTSYAADRLRNQTRDPILLPSPQTGTTPVDVTDPDEALAWLDLEYPNLLAAIRAAAEATMDTHVWTLAWTMTIYLDRRGRWRDSVEALTAALTSARRLTDRPMEAYALRNLGYACAALHRFEDAESDLHEALDIYQQIGDGNGSAQGHLSLSWIYEKMGRHSQALDQAQRALDRYRSTGHRPGQGWALNAVGWHHAQLGNHQETLSCAREALRLLNEIGDVDGQAAAWDSIAYARHDLGEHAEAIGCYHQALNLRRQAGDRYYEARTLVRLGHSYLAAADAPAAREAWQSALHILEELDHPEAADVRTAVDRLHQPVTAEPCSAPESKL